MKDTDNALLKGSPSMTAPSPALTREALALAVTDELGHAIHKQFWGGISEKHQTDERGDPFGDCYKCRIVRDYIRDWVREYAGDKAEAPE